MRSWSLILPLVLLAAACRTDATGDGRAPDAPTDLVGTSLDGAVALRWDDNSYTNDPDIFEQYRIYSASYDLDAGVCGNTFGLEGTTVAPEFLVGALTNGVPRCYAITAASVDGFESDRSNLWSDTPRPDARNVVLNAQQAQTAGAAFRFWQDLNGDGRVQSNELGLVKASTDADADFLIDRAGDGTLYLEPVRAGVTVRFYQRTPVEDLTSIDIAPENDPPADAYESTPIEAQPGFGYVFRIDDGGPFPRFGAVRVTHTGTNLLIFDWSFQTDAGNPELLVGGGAKTGLPVGRPVVVGAR